MYCCKCGKGTARVRPTAVTSPGVKGNFQERVHVISSLWDTQDMDTDPCSNNTTKNMSASRLRTAPQIESGYRVGEQLHDILLYDAGQIAHEAGTAAASRIIDR